jgi:3-oxoacyl-[acyl-carrier protein] reductase
VIVNTRSNRAEADGVVKEIEAAGGKAMAAVADVVDAPTIEKILAAAVERFGPIDILINNAALRAEKSLEQMSFEEWRRITGVILDGAFICVKACLPHLKKNSSGAIVNVGGMSSHTGAAHRPHVVTAKAGLAGFTRALAHELAGKVRVNTVTPAVMQAPRPAGQPEPPHHSFVNLLVGRRGLPEDIAAAVRFLCGPQAGYITGQNIHVNGGAFLG